MLRTALLSVTTFVFALLSATTAYSMEPIVDKVVVVNNPDNTQISFEIRNAFTKEIEEGIKSGIPTTFTFSVEIYRKRNLWLNETLAATKFKHTVKYDTLKEEYEIILEEKPQAVIRIKEIEKVKNIMAAGDGIIVKPSLPLGKGERYQLRIKATLDAINLPFPLNYMLFFVSFWEYETDWCEKEFIIQ